MLLKCSKKHAFLHSTGGIKLTIAILGLIGLTHLALSTGISTCETIFGVYGNNL